MRILGLTDNDGKTARRYDAGAAGQTPRTSSYAMPSRRTSAAKYPKRSRLQPRYRDRRAGGLPAFGPFIVDTGAQQIRSFGL
jgi:hypothetical protein